MTHSVGDRQKLLNRVRRLRGQVEAIERALVADAPCGEIMRQVTTVKGAVAGLMGELVFDHVRSHMVDATRSPSPTETRAAEDLIAVLRSFVAS